MALLSSAIRIAGRSAARETVDEALDPERRMRPVGPESILRPNMPARRTGLSPSHANSGRLPCRTTYGGAGA